LTDIFDGLPRNHFGCVLADPPWTFKTFKQYAPGENRAAPYACMKLADIKALPVRDVAAKDCHLFLWVTGPFLDKSFDVMKAWGFKYSGLGFTWVKLQRSHNKQLRLLSSGDLERELFVGQGYTTRKNCEFALLGRRGNPKRLANDVREVILSPLREHSRKPDESYERIERYAEGPLLELFARQTRPGWSSFGNQVGMFDEVPA